MPYLFLHACIDSSVCAEFIPRMNLAAVRNERFIRVCRVIRDASHSIYILLIYPYAQSLPVYPIAQQQNWKVHSYTWSLYTQKVLLLEIFTARLSAEVLAL